MRSPIKYYGEAVRTVYALEWNDWCGGVYCRTFDTEEERGTFIERIARTDRKGKKNYTTWEQEVKH